MIHLYLNSKTLDTCLNFSYFGILELEEKKNFYNMDGLSEDLKRIVKKVITRGITSTYPKAKKIRTMSYQNVKSVVPSHIIRPKVKKCFSPSPKLKNANIVIDQIIKFRRDQLRDKNNYDSEDSQSDIGFVYDSSLKRQAI